MARQEIEEKFRKLASVDERTSELAWLLYLSGEGNDKKQAEELLDIILHEKIAADFRNQILLDPPKPVFCEGKYLLGHVIYPKGRRFCNFGLHEQEWIKHTLIVGMTGSGKTNLCFQILREFRRIGKPALIFDWKRNYRDLLQLPEFSELEVFTVGRNQVPFQFNPLIPPPEVTPGEWLMKLVDVIKHAYFVGEGVEYLLREAIDAVYDQSGIFKGSVRQAPNFFQVRAQLRSKPVHGRMQLWKASATRVLESLCFIHGLGPVLNTSGQWPYKELLQKTIVLELDALSDADKVFFAEAMILWLYEMRKQESTREYFKHALLIEEGHHILSQAKEKHEGVETIMETCLRQIREFGEAVIVIDQEPNKLSNSIKANTYSKIVFNLGNGIDKKNIAQCLGLSEEDTEYINLLDVGQAIVHCKRQGMSPLLLQCPFADIVKGRIQDSDLISIRQKRNLFKKFSDSI